MRASYKFLPAIANKIISMLQKREDLISLVNWDLDDYVDKNYMSLLRTSIEMRTSQNLSYSYKMIGRLHLRQLVLVFWNNGLISP
jgi:hypothetical protein